MYLFLCKHHDLLMSREGGPTRFRIRLYDVSLLFGSRVLLAVVASQFRTSGLNSVRVALSVPNPNFIDSILDSFRDSFRDYPYELARRAWSTHEESTHGSTQCFLLNRSGIPHSSSLVVGCHTVGPTNDVDDSDETQAAVQLLLLLLLACSRL